MRKTSSIHTQKESENKQERTKATKSIVRLSKNTSHVDSIFARAITENKQEFRSDAE
jgi:hypothetical protein